MAALRDFPTTATAHGRGPWNGARSALRDSGGRCGCPLSLLSIAVEKNPAPPLDSATQMPALQNFPSLISIEALMHFIQGLGAGSIVKTLLAKHVQDASEEAFLLFLGRLVAILARGSRWRRVSGGGRRRSSRASAGTG